MNTSVTAAIEASGLCKSFGATEVLRDVDLAVRPGAVVALLGPSGCGKTTLLRTVAGLERLDAGEVRLGGRLVAGPGTHMAPEKRHVGMVFQDWALFPHLKVAQNVAYGLRRAERRGPRVAEVLEMVGLAGMGERQPATLSGGQQQRVALARALAPRPKVLLLDEPFSNLDTALRAQVRSEVHQLLAELEVTTVFVTHDQEEAFVLGDEVAVMYGGRIVQQATPAELYARPVSPWVARFVGDANLVTGEVRDDRAVTPVGPVPLAGVAGAGGDRSAHRRDGHGLQVLLRPEELRLDPAGGAEAAMATIELHEYYGHDTVYFVRPDAGPTIRVRLGSAPRFHRGDRVLIRYTGPPAVSYPLGAGTPPEDVEQSDDAMPAGSHPRTATVGDGGSLGGQADDGAETAAAADNGDGSDDGKTRPAETPDVAVAGPS
jgi:iron(III) transport system ATP-binding protein